MHAAQRAPEQGGRGHDDPLRRIWEKCAPGTFRNPSLKKINHLVKETAKFVKDFGLNGTVRFWVEDEAAFGRISNPRYCWCRKGFRPVVPYQRIREYNQCFGAAEPLSGDKFFRVLERCNSDSMEIFLEQFAEEYPNDFHVMLATAPVGTPRQNSSSPKMSRLSTLHPAPRR